MIFDHFFACSDTESVVGYHRELDSTTARKATIQIPKRIVIIALAAGGLLLVVLGAAVLLIDHAFQSQAPMPVRPSDDVVALNGARVRYHVWGEGKPEVIMLHGFASSLLMWEKLGPSIQCAGTVALDLPGFGGSDRPTRSYDLDTQARSVLAFMDSLRLDRVTLVGQSMGSSLAAWLAARYPDRVSHLVLFAPSGLPGSLRYSGLHGLLVRPGILNRAATFVVKRGFVRTVLGNSLALQGLTVAASYDSTFANILHDIEQPTLIFWSTGDSTVPFEYLARYQELIPHAKTVVLPMPVGHAGPMQNPARTADRICRFIRGADLDTVSAGAETAR